MAEPTTGGAITGGNWGYSGKGSSSGSSLSNNKGGTKTDFLDLSSFAIDTKLEDYEGTEMSTDDILSLGKGPLNPELFTEEGRKKIKDKLTSHENDQERAEKIAAIVACGYTETDAARLVDGEISADDLYAEIYQEYLTAEDPSQTRFAALLKVMVYKSGFYYSRSDIEQKKADAEAELERVKNADTEAELAFAKKNRDTFADIVANAVLDPGTGKYKYTTPSGKELTLTEEDMKGYRESLAFWETTIANYDDSQTKRISELETEIAGYDQQLADTSKEEFPYKSEEELDARLDEIDAEIARLEEEKAAKEKEIHDKYYGYDIPDESFSDPEFLKTYLDEQPITAWRGVDKEGVDTKGWSIIKISEDKYVMRNGTGGSSTYIGLDGNPSYDSFTAQELIDAGYVITPTHGFDPSRVTEEDKAEVSEIDKKIAAYKAEKAKLEEKKKLIEVEYKWLLINAKYTMQPDFNAKKEYNYDEIRRHSTVLAAYVLPAGKSKFTFFELINDPNANTTYAELMGALLAGIINNKAISYEDGDFYDRSDNCYLTAGDEGVKLIFQNFTDYANKGAFTQEEIDIFNYICNTEGFAAGYEYLMSLYNELDGRYLAIRHQEDVEHARGSVFAGLESLCLAPYEAIVNMRKQYFRKASKQKLKTSDAYSSAATYRETISSDIRREYGEFWGGVFDITYSIEQSLVNTMIVYASGGNPAVALLSTTIIMGTPVYNEALYSALKKGVDDDKAIAYALSCAVIEIAMESYSTVHLVGIASGFDNMISSGALKDTVSKLVAHLPKEMQEYASKLLVMAFCAVSQGLVEFNEEYDTEILTNLAEYIFEGDLSESSQKYQQYIDLGYSETDALIAVLCEVHKDGMTAGMYGFISGTILGGVLGNGSAVDTNVGSEYSNNSEINTGNENNVGEDIKTETATETEVDTNTPKTHLNEAEALTMAQEILDPTSEVTFADLANLDAESVQMVTEGMMPQEIANGLGFLTTDAKIEVFAKLSAEGKVAAFDSLTSEEKYEILIRADVYNWTQTHLHGLTAANASEYLKITPSGDIQIDWPGHGGYKLGTIKTLDTLSGDVVISRVGSKGGTCWGLHLDIDVDAINTSETDAKIRDVTMGDRGILQGDSVVTGDEEAFKGVFHVDQYNNTVHVLNELADGADPSTVEQKLIDMGYTDTQAELLMKEYNKARARDEWAGPDNIYDGLEQQGYNGEVTGTYGEAEEWNDLPGGAIQMTTLLPGWLMIECGIITDVTDGIIINP